MNEITSEWVAKADNDFHSADILLHSGDMPIIDTACFHCQQCVEKYLKAFLTEHRIRFERTHVLVTLLDLCIPIDKNFRKIANDLDSLEGYAVAIRYPGAVISTELAEDAFKVTKRIRSFVRSKLKIK
ncbi:MAG TPA: HEPN domain-containing protein [Anaerolineales bacterium]|nr:HEPN domain-containing protein [Anaerolineales bacterium]